MITWSFACQDDGNKKQNNNKTVHTAKSLRIELNEWVSASMRKINIERDFVVARVLNLFRYVRVYLATSTSMDQIFQHHWRALCSDSLLSTILVGCCFCCFCCFCTDNNVVVVVLKWYAIADGAYLVIFRNW